MRRVAAILLLFSLLSAFAGSPTELYLQGNRAYEEGDFAEAIEAYNSAIAMGGNDSRLFYNLGNAYFRAGLIGEAVLAYERALYLAPRDKDIQHNLDFVRRTRVDVIADKDGNPIRSLYEDTPVGFFYNLLGKFTFGEFILASAIFTMLATLTLFFGIILRGRKKRVFKGLSIAFWSIAIVILIPYAFKKTHIWDSDKAIVIAPKAELRSAPSPTSQLNYTLRPGHE
ncbi:MAG TPA: tetratricopeptide repeat protein, partial [candidate division Zixibacteria bacterium]|nr:tetratricopeptide repeat protein [candidate division Zixibacteria bacterium]